MLHLQLKGEQWLRLACKWMVSHGGQLLSRTRSLRHSSAERHSRDETQQRERDGEGDTETLRRVTVDQRVPCSAFQIDPTYTFLLKTVPD